MAKLNEYKKHHVDAVLDRMDVAFDELIHCMHDLEGYGCKVQERKLDTIVGKLENVINELHDKLKN
jgi:hypothetical protein